MAIAAARGGARRAVGAVAGARAVALAAGGLLGTAVLLVPHKEQVTAAADAPAAAALRAVATVLVVAGALAGRHMLRRFQPREPRYALRFAGLAGIYATVAFVAAGAAHAWPVVAAAHVVGALLTGVVTIAAARAAGAADALSARSAVGIVVAGGVGFLAVWLVPPLVPALSDYAASHEWRYPAMTDGNAGWFVSAGALAGLVALAGFERLARRPATVTTGTDHHHVATDDCVATPPGDRLLDARGIEVRFGSVQVLFGVDLHVAPGEAVALLGVNGAGKSTLLRAVTGLTPPSGGRVWFDGAETTGARGEVMSRRGLLLVPGGKGVFPTLSVDDNLRVAGYHQPRTQYAANVERVLTAFPQLARYRGKPAGLLSGGEQQMLALSRSYLANPKLLAIDELTLGLAPVVVEQLIAFVQSLREAGVALLIVEQSVQVALRLCDRAYFLERGTVRFHGATTDLAGRDDLLRSVFLDGVQPSEPATVPA